MPLTKCTAGDRPGWKWGASGKCFSFTEGDGRSEGLAKRKAYQQGAAAGELAKAELVQLAELVAQAGPSQEPGDFDDDPRALAAAVDASLDSAQEAFGAGENEQGVALVIAAAATVDALLAALGVSDADEVGKADHSIEYLSAVAKLAKKYLPTWLWDQIHRAAMPSSGGRARWRPAPPAVTKAEHSGAMVALYPDPETADQLAMPGGEEPADLHVTLAFLGPSDQVDQGAIVKAVQDYCSTWMGGADKADHPMGGPLEGRVGGHGVFYGSDSSEGQDVLWAHPDVPRLSAFREGLVHALGQQGVAVKSEHGFSPHMTLAYAEPAQKDQPDVGDVHVAGPDWRRRRARKDDDVAGTDGPQLGVYGALPQLPLRFHQVSVVHAGARTDVPFADAPAEKSDVQLEVEILKADAARHLVYGVVISPDQEDSQGDVMSAEDIEHAAHQFLIDHITHQEDWGSPINLQHGPDVDAVPVESYIAPADMEWEGPDGKARTVKQGSWIMVGYVPGDETWTMVERGEITGWSLEGYGRREELDPAA